MSAAKSHTIRSVDIDFNYTGNTDAMVLQQEVHSWTDAFMHALEQELDLLSGESSLLLIDQLVLDVSVDSRNWQEQAAAQIRKQVIEKIAGVPATKPAATKARQVSAAAHFEEAFLHFVHKGYLPWNFATLTAADWQQKTDMLFVNPSRDFIVKLSVLLANNSQYTARLLRSLPPTQQLQLVQYLLQQKAEISQPAADDVIRFYAVLQQANPPSAFTALLQWLLAEWHHINNDEVLAKNLWQSLRYHASANELIVKEFSRFPFSSEALQSIVFASREPTAISVQQALTRAEDAFAHAAIKSFRTTKEEGIFIQHAGLVIIAPFIPVFFERIGLLYEEKIRNLEQAVCLLGFLATGRTFLHEHELVLPKVLCGFTPDVLVDTQGEIDENIQQEARELLASVIEHWSILQNSSADALRETFLQRNGKLSMENNEWVLQVEKGPFDMLLDHLPWNISMIRLSWMKHVLITEWN